MRGLVFFTFLCITGMVAFPSQVKGAHLWEESKLIYLGIPKNATSSVVYNLAQSLSGMDFQAYREQGLYPLPEARRKNAMALQELDKILKKKKQEGYLIFAIVRDPLDRAVSFCMEKIIRRDVATTTDNRFYNGMGIEECLRTVALTKRKSDPHFRPQYHWLLQEDGTPRFNMLIKLENLSEEWKKIQQHVMKMSGVKIPDISHLNSTEEPRKGKPHEYFITPEVRELLEIYYAKDIELMNQYFPE